MFYREAGQFYTSYAKDQGIFQLRQDKYGLWGILFIAFVVIPVGLYLMVQGGLMAATTKDYLYNSILLLLLVNSMAALGLNILTGYCGQISLGTAAFMGVGAFAAFKFSTGMNYRIQKEDEAGELISQLVPMLPPIDNPLILMLLAGAVTAVVGVIFGLPSLRIKGFYLAVATLAAQFFLVWCFSRFEWLYDYVSSSTIQVPPLKLFGLVVTGSETVMRDGQKVTIYPAAETKYLICLATVVFFAFLAKNMARGRVGRAWMAIRDMDIAAQLIGIRPLATKLLAFAVSSFYCGVAGAMLFHLLSRCARGGGGLQHQRIFLRPVHGHHRRVGQHHRIFPRRRLYHAGPNFPDHFSALGRRPVQHPHRCGDRRNTSSS